MEKWYDRPVTPTTGKTIAIKLDWAAGSSEYKLYTVDTVTNQDETA